MELSRPLTVITPTLDGDVLRVLAQADAEFTSGDVHRLLDGPSVRGILNTLKRLSEQGIVSRRPAGRANLYSLNRQHLAAPQVIALARLRDELLDRLARQVAQWTDPPIFGSLFGSGARRDHAVSSDIDILLVRADGGDEDQWDRQTEALSALVTEWTGNDCRTITFTDSDVAARGDREPLLAEVAREGIAFHGTIQWLSAALKVAGRRRSSKP